MGILRMCHKMAMNCLVCPGNLNTNNNPPHLSYFFCLTIHNTIYQTMRTSLLNHFKLLATTFVLSTLVIPVCGKKRIIGGSDVTDKDRYPYFAQPAGSMVCGATLISDDILLSAAHCKGGFIAHGIMLGGNRIDGSQSIHYDVEKEIMHEQFENLTFTNDIMLIKLKGTVPQSVPRVVLNFDTYTPFDGQQLKVIGYGVTSVTNSDVPTYLQSVNFKAMSSQQCFMYWGISQIGKNNTLCTGSMVGGADACFGDSGGPLFVSNTIPEVQVGIVSYGDSCGKAGIPSVNTRISGYKDWIQRNVCSLSSSPPKYCNPVLASVLVPMGAVPVPLRTPTKRPTRLPTRTPIKAPTKAPISRPTGKPIHSPTREPQSRPTRTPVQSSIDLPLTRQIRTPTAAVVPVQSPVQVLEPAKVPVLSPITSDKNPTPLVQSQTIAPVRQRKPIRRCVPLNKRCNSTTKFCCGTAKCVVVAPTKNKKMIITTIKNSVPNKRIRICKDV